MILAATENPTASSQLWRQAFPSGARTRITNDGYDYNWVALPTDGSMIAGQRYGSVANLWTVDLSPPHALRQLTYNTSAESRILSFNVGLNGSLFYTSRRNGVPQALTIGASFLVATMSPEFKTPQRLSPTIIPDATRTPSRSSRSAARVRWTRRLYQWPMIDPTTTANVADIGR